MKDFMQHPSNVGTIGRPSGLRRFILGWVAVLVSGFVLLGGGLSFSISRLHQQTAQMFFDSQSLQSNHRLEANALAAGRLALLDEFEGGEKRLSERQKFIRDGQKALLDLQSQAQEDKERVLSNKINAAFAEFVTGLSNSKNERAQQAILDKLLDYLREHRAIEDDQMRKTLAKSTRIDRQIDNWSAALLLLSSLTLVAGVVELWRRIFLPALELERVARAFGDGNFQARSRVRRNDEMGLLNQTFNDMAQAICDREKDRLTFVATVAHDLKNPLVVIGGAAHLLENKEDILAPEDRVRWMQSIKRNTHQMENLIADLTDSVQSETGQLKLRCASFDLASLARDIMQEQSSSVQTHALHCKALEPCLIFADKRRMERVLMNLISNAIKYSPAGCEVWVNVETHKEQAIFAVRDEGVGIGPEELKTLFRPFARVERTQSMAKGTGLGLSSVKKIVEAHGGLIEIESEIEKGTLVRVKLPLEKEVRS